MLNVPHSRRPARVRAYQLTGLALAGLALITSQLVHSQTSALSQTPLFVNKAQPPLNMLVMGRDHKLYYEAYNDASDLNGDGVIDVGYMPDVIDYYGYFNNHVCYTYGTDNVFKPAAKASGANNKQCSGQWSGDFLNYLTTSRMDAIRRVLYGGMRVVDTNSRTVLQGAYIPRDAHSWGKSYEPDRDLATYRIENYTPFAQPKAGTRHLFAVTTLGEPKDDPLSLAIDQTAAIPHIRFLNDTIFDIWDWVSQEGKAGQNNCAGSGSCAQTAESDVFRFLPSKSYRNLTISTYKSSGGAPNNKADMDTKFTNTATGSNLCGTGPLIAINTVGSDNNPFAGNNGCTQDNYITVMQGQIEFKQAGEYIFVVDGDDAVDVTMDGVMVTQKARVVTGADNTYTVQWDVGSLTNNWGWYGSHSNNRTDIEMWRRAVKISVPTAGWRNIKFRHVEGTGGDSWGLARVVHQYTNKIQDFNIKLETCPADNADLRESNCQPYPNGGTTVYKPVGLLHDFGASGKMNFGLLTGSYDKNIAGGVLRSNIGNFANEVNASTGQFVKNAGGLVDNINRQRILGYNGSTYGACGWITKGPVSDLSDPSFCAMWGNPIAEMMFETVRYFAGATSAHTDYVKSTMSKDNMLGLSKPAWKPPYAPATGTTGSGGGYEWCAKPVMTVISDINPSYDGKVPGSRYASDFAPQLDALKGFDVSAHVDAIGGPSNENINGHQFFIGQSNSTNADGVPSVKTVNSFSWARGLSPQEPSKEGTFYSAGVSRFAANNSIFGTSKGTNPMSTYSVAIASPLPEIRFPVGDGRYVTIAPFAKSVTGSNGGVAELTGAIDNTKFAPTNQIVDYYVERIANTGATDKDPAINNGQPYAEFRINYEDVEQGADHDMDAIARYVIALKDGKVVVQMYSEYAAGGLGQHMGYVISGTTKDGTYLEVRDRDTGSVYYKMNTPPGRDPGYCSTATTDDQIKECTNIGLNAIRTFTPSTSADSGRFLKSPLWYAAKYGMPDRKPSSVTADPDNYFLVTNATTLKDQLTKAFNNIMQTTTSVTAASVSMPTSNLALGADIFRTSFESELWSGDVIRDAIGTDRKTTRVWSAAEELSKVTPTARKVLYASKAPNGSLSLKSFTFASLSAGTDDAAWLNALNIDPVTLTPDGKAKDRIAFLRGARNDALRVRKEIVKGSGKYNVLGDIVNSSLVRVSGGLYNPGMANRLEGTSKYGAFDTAQMALSPMLYVGGNDGMLHAFDTKDGKEVFAYIPSSLKGSLNVLTAPEYGSARGKQHQYFVDGTPVISDVYFGDAWHKVLIGSLGAGGKQIFALDITDPNSPSVLWEFGAEQDAKMGYSMAAPVVARLNNVDATNKGKWVVLLPNGYQGSGSGGGEASLFVLDVATGNVIRRFDMDGGMTADEITASQLGNGLSRVSAVDKDSDGKVDVAYAGDLGGNLWRFDFNSGSSSAWKAQLLYTARDANDKRQSITAAPYVVPHPNGPGSLVTVGTGRFLTDRDKESAQRQSMYAIWDRYGNKGATTPTPLNTANKTRADLQQQAFTAKQIVKNGVTHVGYTLSTNAINWYKTGTTNKADADVKTWGWYVDMPNQTEKVIYDSTLYGEGLVFTTVRTSVDVCSPGIDSNIYAMDPKSGGKLNYAALDLDRDGKVDSDVSGKPTDAAGAQTLMGGEIIGAGGSGETPDPIADGTDRGRQSWRRQPVNVKP